LAVLPLVESSRLRPARSAPLSIASRTMAAAARSFTDPPGLCHSALARIWIPANSALARSRRNNGVLPMRSSSDMPAALGQGVDFLLEYPKVIGRKFDSTLVTQ